MRRLLSALLLLLAPGCARDAPPRLVLATTHTLEDSGVLDTLVAAFRAAHPEQELHVVVAGSGEVLQYGRSGDADVLLTHAPEAEAELLRAGWIEHRRPVMYNDFVVLGPAADPARVRGSTDAVTAFRRLRDARAPFVSRGDDSGTHRKERSLWFATGIVPDWSGYVEAGVGMAEALRLASARGAYILSDRATWMHLQRELSLALLLEDPAALLNQYSVSRAGRARNAAGADIFADWVTGPEAQRLIARYGKAHDGRPLFSPGAPR